MSELTDTQEAMALIGARHRGEDGIPFQRDPLAPCEDYEPRARKPGDWKDCETDGHYLCAECCHKKEAHDE